MDKLCAHPDDSEAGFRDKGFTLGIMRKDYSCLMGKMLLEVSQE